MLHTCIYALKHDRSLTHVPPNQPARTLLNSAPALSVICERYEILKRFQVPPLPLVRFRRALGQYWAVLAGVQVKLLLPR